MSIENRCDTDAVIKSALSSSQQLDLQILNQMRSLFTTPSISAELSNVPQLHPMHYMWPEIATKFQFSEYMGEPFSNCNVSSISTESSEKLLASKKKKRNYISISNAIKDEAYWKRRMKKNEASKRYRENKKIMEQETMMHVAHLENENLRLRREVERLTQETGKNIN